MQKAVYGITHTANGNQNKSIKTVSDDLN